MSSRNGWDTLSGTTWWLYPQACLHYRAVSGRGIMNQFILTKKKKNCTWLLSSGGGREGNRSLQKATEAGPGPH